MGDGKDAGGWAETVRGLAAKRGLRYEEIGGLNPKGGPAALCPGGTNRITGELAEGFWGASCDADEREEGGLFSRKTVLPRSVLAKAHMPDLARVVPLFNVESVEAHERVEQLASRRKVEFESIEFNRRFLATVPADYDPVALRELFSPGFLDWVARIEDEIDFGITEGQLFFLWRLRERTADEYEAALDNAGQLFKRVQSEMEESGLHTYRPGPWHAGLEQFPDGGGG
jgi:hypothetical protein